LWDRVVTETSAESTGTADLPEQPATESFSEQLVAAGFYDRLKLFRRQLPRFARAFRVRSEGRCRTLTQPAVPAEHAAPEFAFSRRAVSAPIAPREAVARSDPAASQLVAATFLEDALPLVRRDLRETTLRAVSAGGIAEESLYTLPIVCGEATTSELEVPGRSRCVPFSEEAAAARAGTRPVVTGTLAQDAIALGRRHIAEPGRVPA